jgi:hypothetical protein
MVYDRLLPKRVLEKMWLVDAEGAIVKNRAHTVMKRQI